MVPWRLPAERLRCEICALRGWAVISLVCFGGHGKQRHSFAGAGFGIPGTRTDISELPNPQCHRCLWKNAPPERRTLGEIWLKKHQVRGWRGVSAAAFERQMLATNKQNLDFRTYCTRIRQRPPNQFKFVPDSRLEVAGFLMRKTAILSFCYIVSGTVRGLAARPGNYFPQVGSTISYVLKWSQMFSNCVLESPANDNRS